VGFGILFFLVALLLAAAVALAPYWQRRYNFYLALAVGVGARLGIMNRPTWYDEVFTLAVVRAPNFWGAVLGDVHPPLFYAIAKVSAAILGPSPLALRMPSLIASLILIYAVYRLTRIYTGSIESAQLAAGFTSLLGAPMNYAAEGRYPALLALCVIGALIALAERRRVLFFVCAVAAAYLHSIGMIYAVVLGLAAAYLSAYWLPVALATAAAVALWVPIMLHQSAQVAAGFWLHAQNPLKFIVEMTVFTMDGIEPSVTVVVYAIVIGWTILGVYMSRHWILKRGALWLLIAIGAPVLLAVLSAVWKPIFLSRALLAPALLFVMTWAVAWPRIPWLWRGAMITAVVLSWYGVLFEPAETFDTRDMKEIFQECADSDFVYITSTNMAIQAMAYAEPPVRIWRHGNNLDQSLTDDAKAALGMFLVSGVEAVPEGKICLIDQVSHRTNETERQEINNLRQTHTLIEDRTLYQDEFYAYQLMKWNNNHDFGR
jgi:hypothetical protein